MKIFTFSTKNIVLKVFLWTHKPSFDNHANIFSLKSQAFSSEGPKTMGEKQFCSNFSSVFSSVHVFCCPDTTEFFSLCHKKLLKVSKKVENSRIYFNHLFSQKVALDRWNALLATLPHLFRQKLDNLTQTPETLEKIPLLPKQFFKRLLWTQRLQFLQTCLKFHAKSPPFLRKDQKLDQINFLLKVFVKLFPWSCRM